jgi:hypothetical protein
MRLDPRLAFTAIGAHRGIPSQCGLGDGGIGDAKAKGRFLEVFKFSNR